MSVASPIAPRALRGNVFDPASGGEVTDYFYRPGNEHNGNGPDPMLYIESALVAGTRLPIVASLGGETTSQIIDLSGWREAALHVVNIASVFIDGACEIHVQYGWDPYFKNGYIEDPNGIPATIVNPGDTFKVLPLLIPIASPQNTYPLTTHFVRFRAVNTDTTVGFQAQWIIRAGL